MTSTSTNLPSSTIAPAGADAIARSPIASLLEALGCSCSPASPDPNARGDTKTFDLLLAPGSARAPRATTASGSPAAAGLDPTALTSFDAPRVRGSWMAVATPADCGDVSEAGDADDVAEVSAITELEAVATAEGEEEPVRSALETAASMLVGILQSLPDEQPQSAEVVAEPEIEGEVVDLVEGGLPDTDVSVGGTDISVELPEGENFTVTIPAGRQSEPVEAHLKNAGRIALREMPEAAANGAGHAAPESRGARAAEVMTALANRLSPARQSNPGTPVEPTVAAPEAVEGTVEIDMTTSGPASVDATIELPEGETIRFTIKPAGAKTNAAEISRTQGEAEIAPSEKSEGGEENSSGDSLKKTFLSLVDKHLAASVKGAGIGIARFSANMPAPATQSTPSAFGTGSIAEAVAGFDVGLVDQTGDYPESTIDSVARRALEMTINVIEAQAGQRGRNTSTVNLRLRLAGEDIAIRVQLRNGEVHTRFQTSSPELREAISREWQIAAADSTQRVLRFHDPEFSNNERFLNDRGSSGQFDREGQSARGQSGARQEVAMSRSFTRRPSVEPVQASAASVAAAFAPGSLHLSTFA